MAKFSELINGKEPVLVDFHAEWCGPCKTMAPILEEVKADLGGLVRIVKVDVDKNPKAAQKFRVQSVPTLILFKEGRQKWRQSGVVPKNALIQVLNQN
ncbi:MAG: thioredoxin [Cyclobacteriaceae bacterium]